MSRPLGAQRPLVIDAGFSAIRFEDDNSVVGGPSLRLSAAARRGSLFGSLDGGTVATIGAASGFATLTGGTRSAHGGGWISELAGELSSVAGSGGNGGVGTALASGRAIWSGRSNGLWLRGSTHLAQRRANMLTGRGLDLGAWWSWPRAHVTATLAQEWTSAQLYTDPFRSGFAGIARVRYTDASVMVHLEGDRASLDVSALARRDADAARLIEPALGATAALWFSDTRAFVLSASRQLPDWIHGADAADAFTVGLRFRQPTPALDRVAHMIPVMQVSDAAGIRTLTVHAAGARTVDVMGDFTDWEPQPLARNGSQFTRPVTISSGTHKLVIRIDGGAWRTAANTPSVEDDLGGKAGLLVVP